MLIREKSDSSQGLQARDRAILLLLIDELGKQREKIGKKALFPKEKRFPSLPSSLASFLPLPLRSSLSLTSLYPSASPFSYLPLSPSLPLSSFPFSPSLY